ncbi:LOW QUALITY PROTEIN: SLAM family member 9 [Thomomys bottae]
METFPWLFLLLLPEAKAYSGDGADPSPLEALQSGVSFPLEIRSGEEVERIIRSSQKRIGPVMPEKEKPATILVIGPYYQDQVSILEPSYSLYISNLTGEDSGLLQPQVTVNFKVSGEGTCDIFMTCSVESELSSGDSSAVGQKGPVFNTSWTGENVLSSCRASNPISNISSRIPAGTFSTGSEQ